MLLDLNTGHLAEPFSGRQWDGEEIRRQVSRRIARFRRQQLARGDRVFLPFGNRLEFFAELLAIWRLGACAVPVGPRLTSFETRALLDTASPQLAVVDEVTGPPGLQCLRNYRNRQLGGRERDEINKGGMKIYPADVDAVVERFEHASDVCTFAVDDESYGQTVGIAVVLNNRGDATVRALHQWMTRHIAEHKLPTSGGLSIRSRGPTELISWPTVSNRNASPQ